MTAFAASWLSLREPHDRRARSGVLVDAVAALFADYPTLSIVDLGCGTGATLRALADHLPPQQSWRLVDNDLSLLARIAAPPHVTIRAEPLDLARDLELALDGPIDLVTTSSLLDLVSPAWLERLVTEVAARRLPFYAALTHDGRIAFDPGDSHDAAMISQFRSHLQTDKGFGPALGPYAPAAAAKLFKAMDYQVMQQNADWVLEPADAVVQLAILAFFAAAAQPGNETRGWLRRRRKLIDGGNSRLRVGHVDLLARPRSDKSKS
jgi:hypothetical protein